MEKNNLKHYFSRTHILAGCALFAIILDRAFKHTAIIFPEIYRPIVGNLMAWKIYLNENFAFGIPIKWNIFFTIASFIIIICIILFLIHSFHKKTKNIVPLLMIVFGAISNIIDRIRYDAVIDYLYIVPASYINIADLLVAFGVLIIIWNSRKKI